MQAKAESIVVIGWVSYTGWLHSLGYHLHGKEVVSLLNTGMMSAVRFLLVVILLRRGCSLSICELSSGKFLTLFGQRCVGS